MNSVTETGVTPESNNSKHVRTDGEVLAAVDLGSNSFHLVLARVVDGQLVIVDRLKEMVQLAAGLDDSKQLTMAAQQRALECLERFGERIRALPPENVRVAGTNTFRMARNADAFLETAERALGHTIEVISGIEEARLIYAGVALDIAPKEERRLVVDIGGGSTELIIGEQFTPIELESLYMGCVTVSQRCFPNGKISAKRFRKAEVLALQELEPVRKRFRRLGWNVAIGSSGTINAAAAIVAAEGWSRHGITRDSLGKLTESIVHAETTDDLSLKTLSRSRAATLPAGVAVLAGIFEALDIEEMRVSEGALREGLLNDLLGRRSQLDARMATVESLMDRYHVDREQAGRVEKTVRDLLSQVADAWELPERRSSELCSWAARLHEIGIHIAHSGYHKHGAYVLENSDLPGFSVQEQRLLAALVRAHRRKFPVHVFDALPARARTAKHLAVLLRLSVLLCRSRSDAPPIRATASGRSLYIRFQEGWLEAHPLTVADLREESELLQSANFDLKFA